MSEASVVHTVLDGGVVTIAAEASDPETLAGSANSFVTMRVGPRINEFGSGTAIFGESVADELGIVLDEEYSFQGGRLRWGTALLYSPSDDTYKSQALGAWEGESYSIKTSVYDGTSEDFVTLMSSFEISETPTGLIMLGKEDGVVEILTTPSPPALRKRAPELGALDVWEHTARAAGELPTWEGAAVEGGELFSDAQGAQETFILVGDSAITRITPAAIPEDVLMDRLTQLIVSWAV